MKGIFVISLDFELLWGMLDHADISTYGDNILGGRRAIPALLEMFKKYGIHATWAVVGMLMAENKDELLRCLPLRQPQYENKRLSNYSYLETIGTDEQVDPYHYGKSLLDMIKRFPNQEIGSHTFSHYYCRENGQSVEDFAEDLASAVKIAAHDDIKIKSLVFPRNQVNPNYLEKMRDKGILAYRGEDSCFIYRGRNSILKRAMRLLDVYFGYVRTHCYELSEVNGSVYNIRASMFLRPYSKKLCFLEPLKLYQIKRQMNKAAKQGKVFHLWFHPHNFGRNLEKNMQNLETILKYYIYLRERYQFKSFNMKEAASLRMRIEE